MMKTRSVSWTVILSTFCWCAAAFAGGSVRWEQVRAEIAKEDPLFLSWVESHFDIRESGGAVRVGRDSTGKSTVPGVEIGTRLPPYKFPAKPKGTEGDFTLHLTFNYGDRSDAKDLWQVIIRRKLPSD